MRHAVLGAGGVGLLLGGALARAGLETLLVLRPGSAASYPGAVRVESAVLGDFEAAPAADTALPGPVDVVWLTVRAEQLEGAFETLPPDALGDAVAVPLQNGVEHVERVRRAYGPERVAAAVIRVEAERAERWRVRQWTPFARIELASGPRVEGIAADARAAGFDVALRDDEATMLWDKLAYLAPLSLATTAADATLGGVRADPARRADLAASRAETFAVARAAGARLDEEAVTAMQEGTPDEMRVIGELELDALGGAVVRAGRRLGVPVPVTERLVAEIAEAGAARAGVV